MKFIVPVGLIHWWYSKICLYLAMWAKLNKISLFIFPLGMRKLLLYLQNYQTQISITLLFVVSLIFIVYLSPREVQFKYEFQKGKPWLHENLVAPFDFSILKTEASLKEEILKTRLQKTIFLKFDDAFSAKAIATFKDDLATAWAEARKEGRFQDSLNAGLYAQFQSLGESNLKEFYKIGVLQPNDDPFFKDFGQVLLVKDKVSQPVELSQFYGIQSVVEKIRGRIKDSLSEEQAGFLMARLAANIRYNVFYEKERSEKYLQNQLDQILPSRGAVLSGELIIAKGNLVDDERFAKLNSLKSVYEGSLSGVRSYYSLLSGQILLVGILLFVLFAFLNQFDKLVLEDISRLTFILVNILLMVLLASIVLSFNAGLIYLIPFAILPMVMRSFFETRLALFVHLVAMLIIGFQVPNSFEFIFLQIVAGVFSVLMVNNLYRRKDLFLTGGKITLVYAVSYFSLAILQEGSVKTIDYGVFAYFVGNGLLTLISFPLIYFQEKIFGFVSEISLLELSDTNNPLLRELAETAPGTFQHSMQVANLTENAIIAIGGNALLARTGALYHDIGKMQSPMYFIENQSTGINPHDELSFEESAEIIIGHVSAGISLAKRNKLPDLLIDFIRTHHGTSMVMYFYKQYIRDFPEDKAASERFTYPGPKPFSKETAVLMMADTVEAASRSIQNPDHDKIDQLVERLIDHQINDGQFENAPITLREIRSVKKIFKKMLMNIYHVRIKYPD